MKSSFTKHTVQKIWILHLDRLGRRSPSEVGNYVLSESACNRARLSHRHFSSLSFSPTTSIRLPLQTPAVSLIVIRNQRALSIDRSLVVKMSSSSVFETWEGTLCLSPYLPLTMWFSLAAAAAEAGMGQVVATEQVNNQFGRLALRQLVLWEATLPLQRTQEQRVAGRTIL